ncbi:hypothetical protein ANOM_010813 [Aspergillus nomiae NRRL 13137]|uniref:Uncharacterized protein n=1 Tax=Aspergillus nomiae NRRL (strain ATCC 15546 / NRRL 13137 / CBS 260.88 / M93) TaxID=1509407 RepID=A0A0L1IPA5_ASPN3|nr:uncharacterized protein ANOM_010813 [Aspergillus nomiae NRRL 13137]KNG81048.1 hypothetical protein ANOM_010813 [Aspergillus nomiae NRRL 13137]
MESPPGSSDRVAYPGNKAENRDQGQPLEQKSLSGNKDSIEDAITSYGLKVKTGLQLDQVRLSDRYVLEVQQVQQLNKASDFTVTDRDKNVTTNTSQESTEMSTSTKDEMVLCSEETQKQALEKKKLRTEAIAFICSQTQARLARFGALSEEISLCRTSEQYHCYPNDSKSLSIPNQVPTELSITSTVTMEPVQASKKKKKKKSKKKPKKRVPLDIGSIDSLNMRKLNQASLSARVPSVQSSSEEAPSSDGPSCLTQSQDLSESSPSLYLQESNLKTKHMISADLGKDFAAPCATQYKNRLQVEGKDTTECHEGCSMECVLSTGPREQTYRDALLGTMDHRDKRRVSGTDPTTKDDIAEHNAALHAIPTPLAIEEWPSITGQTPAGRDTRDTSPKAASSIDSVQDEEVSNTGSSTRAQPSRLGHSTCKNKASSRERLPPIQEATSETAQGYPRVKPLSPHAERGSISSEVQSHLTCTPKSSKSTSTGWTSAEPQGTPQTESSEIDNTETKNDHQKISTETRTVVISQTKGSHAHPSSSLSLERPGQCATAAQKYISTQKPEGFFWQLDSHGFPCAKAECEKRCNLWDGATVICPRCGPFSEIRYCCKEHLLEDIKYHWLYCGQMTFEHPCRENSIPRDVRDGPLLVPCLHPYDTPERHRQAVYFNAKVREGDYFIFSDWTDLVKAGFPENNVEVRCSSRVVYTIRFEDASEKDRFRRVLATCLFMTIEVTELVDYLFRLIRDKLRSLAAPIELEATLKYQFQQEFCVTLQPHITGERHACVTDWDGRNRRNCQDAICRAEYRRLLGSLGGKGHCQLIDHLEGSYWILRAVRTTHPGVSDAKARMCGEGFSDVADEDRREFRRGAGWDGAGTGDMEIEGINDD